MRSLLLACLGLLSCLPVRADFVDFLVGKHEVEVITNSEVTPQGALLKPVTPQDPVYFVAVNMGYKDFGGMIAGDKIPQDKEMVKTIFRVLAKQGYLPATTKHAPTQLLIFFYGTMYVNKMPSMNPDMPDVQTNYYQMLKFLGGEKLGLINKDPFVTQSMPQSDQMMFVNYDAQTVMETARDDLYVAAIAGYDYASMTSSKPKMLWRTKIACPSRGLAMDATLPSMLVIAGPNIGKELKQPVWVRAEDRFKAEVKVGNPVVEGYIDSGKLPVMNVSGEGSGSEKSNSDKKK